METTGEGARPRPTKSLSRTIILTGCLIVAGSLLLSDGIAYSYTYGILKQKSIESAKVQLSSLSRQFTALTNDIEKVAVSEALNNETQRFLRRPMSSDLYTRYSQRAEISRQLSGLAVQRDYLLNMTVVKTEPILTDDDVILSPMKTGYGIDTRTYLQMLGQPWYTGMPTGQHDYYSRPTSIRLLSGEVEILPYILTINDVEAPDRAIGKIVLNIRYDYLKRAFAASVAEGDSMYWLDGAQRLLSGENQGATDPKTVTETARAVPPGAVEIRAQASAYVLVDRTLKNGWTFVSVIPYQVIESRLQGILFFFFVYAAAILALTYAIFLPLMLGIVKPLTVLAQAMRQVSDGHLAVEFQVTRRDDEVGELARRFEQMLADLQEHVRKEAAMEREEKRMQLDLLLAQINPHFIYNTLQTIVYMAKKHGADDIAQVTRSFIAVLQEVVRISDGGLTSTLGQEVVMVTQYLAIQQFRYADRFTVQWRIDPALHDLPIPRSVLQPLVENALQHGILPLPRPGNIAITTHQTGATVTIEVADDGVGIAADRLETLLLSDLNQAERQGMRSIGLKNLNERIKHIHGPQYGISIDSLHGRYTKVSVILPAITEN